MNILILGSGGREHALAAAYSKSRKVERVFVAPGNDLMGYQTESVVTIPDIKATDASSILTLIKEHNIDLVDVAQDDPLAQGMVDSLQAHGIMTCGPTQKAAEIEWNKDWARRFMQKYSLPTPTFHSFTNHQEALRYVQSLPEQVLYIKAAGLAAGKGAIRTENREQAKEAIHHMSSLGTAGKTFLIEHCIVGEEFSLFALCDGKDYRVVQLAQDHKSVFNAGHGPNTGGMGSVAPARTQSKRLLKEIEQKILQPFMEGMQHEHRPYSGILYLGGILTTHGVNIIEFNARWGDPEAEVILPAIQTDYLSIVTALAKKQLAKLSLKLDNKTRISIAGCAQGYPGDYSHVVGKEIFGLENAMKLPGITIFGAGVKRKGKRFFVNGGRIFHLIAEGRDIREARQRAYAAMALITVSGNNLHYRTDIGWQDTERRYQ